MVTRIGGLASGMDIDALVEKLMQAEKSPLNKLQQKKQTYEWQRDAYRDVNTKLKTVDTYIADNLVLKTLNSKTASSSNSSLVTATATGQASGTLSIEAVTQLATAASGIGNQINATGDTKLSTYFASQGKTLPPSIELQSIDKNGQLGEKTKIEINSNMSIKDFVSAVNNSSSGVSAIFENGRLSVTANNTGKEVNGGDAIQTNDAGKQLLATLGLGNGTGPIVTEQGKNAVFQVNGIVTERSSNTFNINGYNVTLSSTFNEATLFSGTKKNLDDALESLATKYNHTFSAAESDTSSKYAEFANMLINESNNKTTAHNNAKNAYTDAKNELLPQNNSLLDANYNSLGSETKEFLSNLTDEQRTELSNIDLLDNTAIDASQLTEKQKKYLKELATINNSELGNLNALTESDLNEIKVNTAGNVYSSLSTITINKLADLNYGDITASTEISDDDKATFLRIGEDGFNKIKNYNTQLPRLIADVNTKNTALQNVKSDIEYLNGKGNEYIAAGDIANSATTSTVPKVTLTSTTNTDDMIAKIKDFVNTYNGLIKDLNNQTKQSKYRDYTPLTDEQKKDMSENEIKLWEEKSKSGLLRNDSIISKGLSSMRALIYQTNPAIDDTKFNSLFSIGITSSKSYNDGGTLEIDEDKLRKAIEENPDAVEKLFKNTSGKVDDTIQVTDPVTGNVTSKKADTRGFLDKLRESIKSFEINIEQKAGRSTMTDNQYSIGKSLVDADKRIDSWKSKLEIIEARYWKQFSAMETAINKGNQQSSLFTQQGQ